MKVTEEQLQKAKEIAKQHNEKLESEPTFRLHPETGKVQVLCFARFTNESQRYLWARGLTNSLNRTWRTLL